MLSYGFKIEVWGEYACFSRPELKVERVSYDVMTPSAARGILEAVMWKPAIRYIIDEIAVCSPIRFENLRRNEVAFKANAFEPKAANSDRQQRAAIILKDVRYVLTAHFEMTSKAGETDNEGKFTDMIRRRLEKGQNFHTPYLGTREFPANVKLIGEYETTPAPIDETRSLGLMLHDIDYIIETDKNGMEIVKEFKPTYFIAVMKSGVIDLRNVEVLQ